MYLYTYSAFRNPRSISHTILLKFVIFLPLFPFFLKESNWENLGSILGKKKLFCIGNGAEFRPQIRQIESPVFASFYFPQLFVIKAVRPLTQRPKEKKYLAG